MKVGTEVCVVLYCFPAHGSAVGPYTGGGLLRGEAVALVRPATSPLLPFRATDGPCVPGVARRHPPLALQPVSPSSSRRLRGKGAEATTRFSARARQA